MNAVIRASARIPEGDLRKMFALHARAYAHATYAKFKRDLRQKHWSILLTGAAGEIQGYSSLEIFPAVRDKKPCRVLYSGDTLVAREQRRDYLLAIAFVQCIHRASQLFPGRELWWLLTSKGFRTYRFLPVYFKEFFPRHDVPTPMGRARFLRALGRRKFGKRFNPTTGIIVPGRTGDYLAGAEAEIPRAKLDDPHVRYFIQRNPGYRRGEELMCLARLAANNIRRDIYRRFLASPRVTWEGGA